MRLFALCHQCVKLEALMTALCLLALPHVQVPQEATFTEEEMRDPKEDWYDRVEAGCNG